MAKKKEIQTVTSSSLIINKNEFEKQVNDRIETGKELLSYPVKILSTRLNSLREKTNVYDETEVKSFLSEYDKWKQFNIELLKRSFDISDNEYLQEYENKISTNVWSDWVKERKYDIQKQITVFESLIERLSLIPSNIKDKIEITEENISTNKVFIVHGHDNEVKQTVARTISQLKLEPIILHEQTDQGRTVIEKFEQNSLDVNFAIILLTGDDEGKAKMETDYKTRARQNVVFEMGYFIGKLGRKRVFLLLENGVDKPGDLDGIVYVPIDNADGWKLKLVRELKAAGYSVTADDL
ncbi:TIR domain-containing protein [Labilibaculum euxinus]|uniref:Nucleotide-binding protein n=1 Tax=Labilibaculum euxinus TaxID=2686357 RepID=A0A7M4DBH2_9BACT|nr:nucleotide-binding protein [Labilibaculum euxinus]MUP40001.1 nucleotide-binding protein [Labilibaculum euxinus]MVB09206.1 nucleotide-binding protein [Labilibaculum euxinus]